MQNILVYIIVAAALAYIGRMIYKAFAHKNNAGCEHCGQEGAKLKKHKTAPDQ